MKIEKKGNIYKKQSWLKEHKEELWFTATVITGFAVFVVGMILRG